MQKRKTKLAVAASVIGIGAILFLLGFSNKIDHDKCIAEGRTLINEFYATPRAATFSCTPDVSGSLFVIGSIVEATGLILLILGLTDVSFISLSRAKR